MTDHANTYPWVEGRTLALLQGTTRMLDLGDIYIPDPSVGMLGEPGWFCTPATQPERELFLSTDGVLYGCIAPAGVADNYDEPVGEHLGLRVHALNLQLAGALAELGQEIHELHELVRQLQREVPA